VDDGEGGGYVVYMVQIMTFLRQYAVEADSLEEAQAEGKRLFDAELKDGKSQAAFSNEIVVMAQEASEVLPL
jgi:hypothetical protein